MACHSQERLGGRYGSYIDCIRASHMVVESSLLAGSCGG